ncbi:MAG: flagellar protein FlaG [Acidobacteria bacterium]|nr:flagellar protein FlaG [Acidobacteriota bacterium]
MDTKSVDRSISALPAADASTEQKQVEERREIVKAVKAINETELFGENYELTFVLDRETHRPLLRIIDRQTREVIRQLPPEYTLRGSGANLPR